MRQQLKPLQLQIAHGVKLTRTTGLTIQFLPKTAVLLTNTSRIFIWQLIFFNLMVPFTVTGDCVMYGICGQLNGTDLNCNATNNNGTPKPIKDEAYLNRLYSYCPDLFSSNNNNNSINETLLCCDEIQIDQLITQLYMAESLISKCPPCFYNLKQSICDMICSPNQDKWLRVAETVVIPSAPQVKDVISLCDDTDTLNGVCNSDKSATKSTVSEVELITAVDMFICERYVQDVYDSCKDVQLVCTGRSIMKDFCGERKKPKSIETANVGEQQSSFDCNAKTWFEWIGDPQNGFTPFKINYLYSTWNEGMELYTKYTVPCCGSISGYFNDSCSSDDCTDQSCSSSIDPPTTTDDPSSSAGFFSIISIALEISCISALIIHTITTLVTL